MYTSSTSFGSSYFPFVPAILTQALIRKTGIGLLVAAYVLALCTWLAAPAYARVNAQPGPPILAEYAGPWPVFVACGLTLNGLVLALIPVRRGLLATCYVQTSAIWLSTVSAHSAGDSHRHRPTLFGGARSAPAWRSYLHDLHGSWFGQPHVGRTATFQARSLWCCRSK